MFPADAVILRTIIQQHMAQHMDTGNELTHHRQLSFLTNPTTFSKQYRTQSLPFQSIIDSEAPN